MRNKKTDQLGQMDYELLSVRQAEPSETLRQMPATILREKWVQEPDYGTKTENILESPQLSEQLCKSLLQHGQKKIKKSSVVFWMTSLRICLVHRLLIQYANHIKVSMVMRDFHNICAVILTYNF